MVAANSTTPRFRSHQVVATTKTISGTPRYIRTV